MPCTKQYLKARFASFINAIRHLLRSLILFLLLYLCLIMSFFEMKIRSIADAATAFFALLKPLRRAASFADLIITENTFKLDKCALQRLATTYRCRSFETRFNDIACELRDLNDAPISSDDGKALEALFKDPSINFHRTANSLHGATVAANSLSSSSKRLCLISKTMKDLPGFKTCAEDTFQVVARMKTILKKYYQDAHRACKKTSFKPSVFIDNDSDTVLATRGSPVPRPVSKRLKHPQGGCSTDMDNGKKKCCNSQSRRKSQKRRDSRCPQRDYKVFISHCGKDKKTIAIPLHERLKEAGVCNFVDKASLVIGNNARDAMNEAIKTVPICVFIVSPEAAARKWPMKELELFLKRQANAKKKGEPLPIVIPVFYRMSVDQCTGSADVDLFNIQSSSTNATVFREEGFFRRVEDGEADMKTVRGILKKLTEITGIENDECASNENTRDAQKRRDKLLDRILSAALDAVNRV